MFQGLWYTEGNLQADKIILFGAFVGYSNDDSKSMQLNDVRAVQTPTLSRIEFKVKRTQTSPTRIQEEASRDNDEALIIQSVKQTDDDLYNIVLIPVKDGRPLPAVSRQGLTRDAAMAFVRSTLLTLEKRPEHDFPTYIAKTNRALGGPIPPPSEEGILDGRNVIIDLNRFLRAEDKMRCLLYRQL